MNYCLLLISPTRPSSATLSPTSEQLTLSPLSDGQDAAELLRGEASFDVYTKVLNLGVAVSAPERAQVGSPKIARFAAPTAEQVWFACALFPSLPPSLPRSLTLSLFLLPYLPFLTSSCFADVSEWHAMQSAIQLYHPSRL